MFCGLCGCCEALGGWGRGRGWEAFLGRGAVLERGPRSASIISTSLEVDMLLLAYIVLREGHDVRLHMTCRGEGSGDYLMVSIAEMHFDIPSKCGDGRLSPVPTSRCESVVVPSLHTMMQLW